MKNILLLFAILFANNDFAQNTDTASQAGIATNGANLATPKSSPHSRHRKIKREPSSTIEYRSLVLSTNFTIPIIRFNPIDNRALDKDKLGNVSFFNSIGAGVGLYAGRLTETTDENSEPINTELNNTFGIQGGFLFAANSNSTSQTNIFALTMAMSILNFQVGYGYELGTVGSNEKRGFVTLAYGIPLYKLAKGGFYVISKSEAIDEEAGFAD